MARTAELETGRLKLRQWRQGGYRPFAGLDADSDVMKCYPGALTEAESNSFAHKIASLDAKRRRGCWAAELKTTHGFIGFVGLRQTAVESP